MKRFATPALAALAAAASLLAGAAHVQPNMGQVFTCVNAAGRMLTSDRLIAECMDREQRVLARDGTLIRIVPAQLTAEEFAAKEERDRKAAAEKKAKADAIRRDRLLMERFPNQEAHDRARESALEDARAAIKLSDSRVAELARERKPLMEEAEFYQGKQMPAKLKAALDANEAAVVAQRDAQSQAKGELDRIAKRFDAELAHLKKLWAGAPLGSQVNLADAEAAGKATKPKTPTPNNRQ